MNKSSKSFQIPVQNGTFTIYEAGRARLDMGGKFYWEFVLSKWDIYYQHNWKYCIWKVNWDFESCPDYLWCTEEDWDICYSIFSSEDYFMTRAEVEVLYQKYQLLSIT